MNDLAAEEPQSNILVVDDTPDNLRLLSTLLTERGYHVRAASNGNMALKAAIDPIPDLILLDVRMPQMNGYQVCQALKAQESTHTVPVIFLSALNDVTDKIKAFEVGGADYITKPFQVEEVILRVETQLKLRRLQEQLQSQNLLLKQEVCERETILRQRQQVETAVRRQAERERVIKEVTQRIHQSLDLDAILTTTVLEVRQFLQTDRVLIYRFPEVSFIQATLATDALQHPDGVVAVESVSSPRLSILGQAIPAASDRDTWRAPYRQGQAEVIYNIHSSLLPPQHFDRLVQLQVQASLAAPILQGKELWGLLIAHHCAGSRIWQQAEIDFMTQLASQMTIAIHQSELYQQIQQLNVDLEVQVKRRTAELEQAFDFEATLKRITDKVRDSLDENQIMQQAVEELALALKALSCNAALYDYDRGISTICYEYTTLHHSSVGRVARLSDYPEIYNQILKRLPSQFCSVVPSPVRGHVTMLAYPILDDQSVMGDLWLVNHKDYCFTEQDIRLVQQVSNQCAIALRQARLYQEAQAQVKELERLNRLKDDFLSTVSHELRTPMANIKMAAKMLDIVLKQHGVFENESLPADRYFQILQSECKREISLIDDLLDLSRLEAETEPLPTIELKLDPWAHRVVEPFIDKAESQNLQLRVEIPEGLPPLLSDPNSLGRILGELLTNACKYTPPGGEIVLSARQVGELIELSVTNIGVEIPAPEHDRIFDKFYRIPNSDPWKHGGTGLGLALVKKLLERLNATIRVESAAGQTVFSTRFPTQRLSSSIAPSGEIARGSRV
jgi:signal transduction histidine kinase/DNA-binding response OmpR family regulator